MSAKFLLLLSKVKPIWKRISNLFLDFENEVYSVEGTPSTLSSYVTHSRSGNATMTDSDGLIKWAPHNLLTYSEDFDNAAWIKTNTSLSGGTVTVSSTLGNHRVDFPTFSTTGRITAFLRVAANGYSHVGLREQTSSGAEAVFYLSGSGSVPYSTAGTGNNLSTSISNDGDGYYTISLSITAASFTTVRFYVLDSNPASNLNSYTWSGDDSSGVILQRGWVHRSDLGGMVDNPDRGDSYVPTTSSAVYLPRRGHHIYNGSAWVNEGLLVESESRQNLLTYSEDFTDAYWTKGVDAATLAIDAIGPDGETSAVTLVDNNAGGTGTNLNVQRNVTVSTSTAYTLSIFAKANGLDWLNFTIAGFTTPGTSRAYFDLNNGVKGAVDVGFSSSTIKDCGSGWYRCSVSFTTDTSDTTGQIYIAAASADGNVSINLDSTSSILIYGAQFEAGATPSSYIPTAGSTVTRAAETLTVPAANLPYPSPVVIGSELVTNGTFDTDSDWVKGTGWTISGGGAVMTSASGDLTQAFPLDVDAVYEFSFDFVKTGGSGVRLYFGGINGGAPQIGATSTGHYTMIAKPTAGVTSGVGFRPLSGADSGTIDNISVKEINPLSVSIQMDGTMTYADTNVATEVIFHRWLFDGNNQIQARLDTASTDTGQVQFYSIANTVVDVVESSATAYSPGINVPFNIASRHGSTFINGAVDGTALTANTTPVSFPDLETTDLELAYDFMGTIRTFRIWDEDLTDEGIEYVSQ